MTSTQKRKDFQDWKNDLEERLAWYLFNLPEDQDKKILEATWTIKP